MKTINQTVAVTAMYFSQNKSELQEYPRRMEWAGQSYTFDSGLACSVQKGGTSLRVFQMTDGHSDYRLRFDTAERSWTLLGVS